MNLSEQRIEELNCVLGLDCSKYQGNINWDTAYNTDGIKFAFVKITEGTTYSEDAVFGVKGRVESAQKSGVKIGYYHFARPGDFTSPEDDANNEVANIKTHLDLLPKADLPLVLDIEAYAANVVWDNKVDDMNRFIITFINGLKEIGVDVIIYSYKCFMDTNTTLNFSSNPLWIAAYPNDPETSFPAIPKEWSDWNIWQFTSKGSLSCYNGDIDLDVMKVDYFNKF